MADIYKIKIGNETHNLPFLPLSGGTLTGENDILTLKNNNGKIVGLKFDRSATGNTSWSIRDEGGNLYFKDHTSNTDRLTLMENTQGGAAYFAGAIYENGTRVLTSLPSHNHDSSYLKLTGGQLLTDSFGIKFGDTDKFIHWSYVDSFDPAASWRIGVTGTGSSDTNYFKIQSGTSSTTATTWNDALCISQNSFITHFATTPYVVDSAQYVSLANHTHTGYASSGHTHTKADIGLGNVQNTAIYIRSAYVNGDNWAMAGSNSNNSFNIYAPTGAGTSGQFLQSTGGVPTWVSDIKLSNASSGDTPKIIFQRGGDDNYYDWDIYNTGGKLTFRFNSSGTWKTIMELYDNGINGYLNGNISGSAASATKATQDSDGNTINSTYLKLGGGTMNGKIIMGGVNSSSSPSSTSQIVWGSSGAAISSNGNNVIINPSSSSTTGQIIITPGSNPSIKVNGTNVALAGHTHNYIPTGGGVAIGSSSARYTNAYFSGSVSAKSGFYEDSDERLKDIQAPLTTDLEKLSHLRKVYFNFKEDPSKTHIGVIAQDIKELYPEIVNETDEGTLNVDYSKLSVIALDAVDQLNESNKELTKKYNELEEKLNSIIKYLNL